MSRVPAGVGGSLGSTRARTCRCLSRQSLSEARTKTEPGRETETPDGITHPFAVERTPPWEPARDDR
jgi:hypothetical protein